MLNRQVLNVCVSGAAGNIAYSFFNSLGSGDVFGTQCEFNLRLLELQEKLDELKILQLEIEDCCFKYCRKITIHTSPDEAFQDLDFAILMGGASRKPGMERKDLFDSNRKVFEEQGKSINTFAKKSCKVLVVANPANTNCLIISNNAPSIPRSNFSCLTRLDYNRAVSQLAIKCQCSSNQVKSLIIWGNHSLTQFPDLTYCKIKGKPASQVLPKQWLEDEFITMIQRRGGKILWAKGISSSISAAMAITDHINDWRLGSQEIASMGVILDEELYGVPKDLCVSMPVICKGNYQVEIVKGLTINDHQSKRIAVTVEELKKERELIQQAPEDD